VPRRARHLPPRHHQLRLPIALPPRRHPETPAKSMTCAWTQTQQTSSTGCHGFRPVQPLPPNCRAQWPRNKAQIAILCNPHVD
jgi:hypothetical protein